MNFNYIVRELFHEGWEVTAGFKNLVDATDFINTTSGIYEIWGKSVVNNSSRRLTSKKVRMEVNKK